MLVDYEGDPAGSYAERSIPDRMIGAHGDAAFADYVCLDSYSYRFGGKKPRHESTME